MKPQTTFKTPYQQHRNYDGLDCVILGMIPTEKYDMQEVGPMYYVRFDSGVIIEAWPEELGLGVYNLTKTEAERAL